MVPDHTYLTWSMHSNLSRSHQQSWAGPLVLRKRAPETIHNMPADRSTSLYPVSLPGQLLKQWGQSQPPVDGRLLGLPGPYHWHTIDTFNTCSQGPTHRSLTDTGGGYHHLRAPPGLRLSHLNMASSKMWYEAPIADPWSFDHSTSTEVYIYAIAIANVIQTLARSSRVTWKVFIM
jgi:hypothetical protein